MRLHLGSVISGTLRLPDLLCAFAHTLALHQHHGNAGVIKDATELALIPYDSWTDEQIDDAHNLLDALTKRLDDLAPKGYYFGAHPGDGSDFGVWQKEDEYEDD